MLYSFARHLCVLFACTSCIVPVFSQAPSFEHIAAFEGGTVLALAMSSDGIVYAGTDGGGVYRSVDNGDSWEEINDTTIRNSTGGGGSIQTLAVDQDGVVYAGSVGGHIFRSTDRGDSWTRVLAAGNPEGFGGAIVLTVSKHTVIIAGVNDRILRSTDGIRWIPGVTDTTLNYRPLISLGADSSGHVLYGTTQSLSINDENATTGFRSVPFATPEFSGNFSSIAYDHRRGHWYVGTPAGIHRTRDILARPMPEWEWVYHSPSFSATRSIAVSSNGDVYATTNSYGVQFSSDGGTTWTKLTLPRVRAPKPVLVNARSEPLLGMPDQGILRSSDHGSTWTSQVQGLHAITVTALKSVGSGRMFAGTYGRGCFRSDDGGATWVPVNTGLNDNQVRSLTRTTRGSLFAGMYSGNIYRSTNDGESWQLVLRDTGNGEACALLASKAGALLAGYRDYRVHRSPDDGATWQYLDSTFHWVLNIAQDSSDNIFISGRSSTIGRSTNDGVDWSYVANPGGSENGGLLVAPDGALIASCWGIFSAGSIYRSTDAGATWANIGGDLTGRRIFSIAANRNGYLFAAGGGAGIHSSSDNGTTWIHFGDTFLGASYFGMTTDENGYLFAAPPGQGLYRSIQKFSALPRDTRPAAGDIVGAHVRTDGFVAVSLRIEHACRVTVSLHDLIGQQVLSLSPGTLPPGEQHLSLDIKGIPSGMYLCRVLVGSEHATTMVSITH